MFVFLFCYMQILCKKTRQNKELIREKMVWQIALSSPENKAIATLEYDDVETSAFLDVFPFYVNQVSYFYLGFQASLCIPTVLNATQDLFKRTIFLFLDVALR